MSALTEIILIVALSLGLGTYVPARLRRDARWAIDDAEAERGWGPASPPSISRDRRKHDHDELPRDGHPFHPHPG